MERGTKVKSEDYKLIITKMNFNVLYLEYLNHQFTTIGEFKHQDGSFVM